MKALNFIFCLALIVFGVNALYEGENITPLNNENFNKEVIDIAQVNVVVFYKNEGANERLTKEITTVSDKLRGFIKVGSVNCEIEENESLCITEEVTEYPQINVYYPAPADGNSKGVIKKSRIVYQGPKKAKYIAEYATKSIVSLVAPIIGGETVTNAKINYNAFLNVKTYPKLILCTDKPETPLLFRALSLEYFGKLILGEISHTEKDLIEKLNVTKFPTIFYYEAESNEPILFEGKGNHDGIVAFIEEREKITKENAEKAKKQEQLYDPMPEEIKTQEDLLKCINGYGVCAISILAYEPDFEESVKQHNDEIEILKNLKEQNKKVGGPFKYVWINSVEHGKKFIKDFDVPDMLPVFMIVNGKKKVYRVDRGAFVEESISSFLKDVRMGRGRFFTYKFEPQLDYDNVKDEL
ncbi:hypothetical protein BCR32DRAFT_288960 [Anaeromyces robustus]|uniref:protein disulfide-isomerase n=1 Tax=Anaeromyces robustus TaxID=1754192 RepID=A0A1Y1XQU8_9FUNG|nr:hypothetical protein BCR32DRAFT_288960 [Anaeromyces robustus]|eukprot:ORX88025.1 hypothetical protein BCR32DRAFT_288960 [Anaeromyces robustus]